MHGHSACGADAPVVAQRRSFASALFAQQKVNRAAFSPKKFFNKTFADETGGSGNEIMHLVVPFVVGCKRLKM